MDDFRLLKADKGWSLEFKDSCTGDWKNKWFLDGQKATVINTPEGMVFKAGDIEESPYHGVLWTKKSFDGDVKIEYDFTRLDSIRNIWVNIIYIQATGSGSGPYVQDISQWNNLREIPSMGTYFLNMDLLHISYAAYGSKAVPDGEDYIRVRRYSPETGTGTLENTEIPPTQYNSGLFLPGVTYHITIIKEGGMLYFHAECGNIKRLYSWDISKVKPVNKGRIGLRHMFTRTSRYANFQVYAK